MEERNLDFETIKELCERISALETKLSDFIDVNSETLAEIRKSLKSLNDLSHSFSQRISKLETEVKWFAKIPIVFLLAMNVFLSLLIFIKNFIK